MGTHYTAVIVGAGQVGLAMSRSLTDLSIDHLVPERGPDRRTLAARALGFPPPPPPPTG